MRVGAMLIGATHIKAVPNAAGIGACILAIAGHVAHVTLNIAAGVLSVAAMSSYIPLHEGTTFVANAAVGTDISCRALASSGVEGW